MPDELETLPEAEPLLIGSNVWVAIGDVMHSGRIISENEQNRLVQLTKTGAVYIAEKKKGGVFPTSTARLEPVQEPTASLSGRIATGATWLIFAVGFVSSLWYAYQAVAWILHIQR